MIFSAHYIICGKYDDSLEITWSECRVAKLSDRYYCRNMARRYRIWCSCSFTFRTEKPGRNIINNIVKHLTQESFNSPRLTAAETQTFLDPASWCTYQFGFYCRYADTRKIVRARTTYVCLHKLAGVEHTHSKMTPTPFTRVTHSNNIYAPFCPSIFVYRALFFRFCCAVSFWCHVLFIFGTQR